MKRKSGLMSSLGYGAAGTVRGKKGDEASLWGRRGRSHAQSVPASSRFSANGTEGTWAKPDHPCPVPKEKRGRAESLCWTWIVLLAILFFFFWLLFVFWWLSLWVGKWKLLYYRLYICSTFLSNTINKRKSKCKKEGKKRELGSSK